MLTITFRALSAILTEQCILFNHKKLYETERWLQPKRKQNKILKTR